MVPVIVILTIVVFIAADVATRLMLKRHHEQKLREERQAALDIGLRLEFTDEAPSLKRVEVERPKARILAVDDEPVILDSFRKILVLAGYSVDTVETGPEAVGLVRKNDYDFVFTDLKMPDFDGLEVTKAVHHLRPDVSIVMITGYGTIESAVAAMQYGAVDYVQKPFTEDELLTFVAQSVIRRNARRQEEMPPTFHLLRTTHLGSGRPNVIDVAPGVFVTPEHCWVALEGTGEVKVGIDDFCVKLLRHIERVDLPRAKREIGKGDPLFSLSSNGSTLTFRSPVNGVVSRVNDDLASSPEAFEAAPYRQRWICCIDGRGESSGMQLWTPGSAGLAWYEGELEAFRAARERLGAETVEGSGNEADSSWRAFGAAFLAER